MTRPSVCKLLLAVCVLLLLYPPWSKPSRVYPATSGGWYKDFDGGPAKFHPAVGEQRVPSESYGYDFLFATTGSSYGIRPSDCTIDWARLGLQFLAVGIAGGLAIACTPAGAAFSPEEKDTKQETTSAQVRS
jgi:hypothetical protein